MRIALVHKRLDRHGGTERQLVHLACHLLEAGHGVDVFCRSVRVDPPPGLVVHVMPRLPLGSLGELVLFSRWARAAVTRCERRQGPFDVRHAFGRTVGQDIYRVGGGCHATYLEHAHALDRPLWWRRWARRTPLQRARVRLEEHLFTADPPPWVITNSEMARSDLTFRFGLPAERVTVVRNGVDLDRFRPPTSAERSATRADWKLPVDAPVVLFLGTGYARKGVASCLRALVRARVGHPDLHLVVAGKEPRAGRYRRLARDLDVDHAVRWLGPQRAPERCYHGADVYTLPTAYDPAANSTLEALASGLPVVTTTMNGAAEILDTGVHGAVLPTPVRPDELAEAWSAWLGAPAGTSALCRARAAEHPAGVSSRKILDVYRVVRQHRARRVGASIP